MNIPILDVPFSKQDRAFLKEGLDEILDSGYLTQGDKTEAFEEAFADFTGANHAVACSNGTSAIELILRGLEIEDQSVIVPTNTFVATAFAVLHSGNRVIFADSDPGTLALDPDDVLDRIEDDTAAVITVHIGGYVDPNLDELRDVCEAHDLELVEDAAHAHGATLNGEHAGTLGRAGAFSFYPTKVLTTGEGGIVTTDDPELASGIRQIRNHGKDPDRGDAITRIGHNFRMSEFTALVGLQQVRTAGDKVAERRRIADHYDAALSDIPGVEPLEVPPGVDPSYYKYVVYLEGALDRDEVKTRMADAHGVSLTGEVYADLCHEAPVWKDRRLDGSSRNGEPAHIQDQDFPGAETIRDNHACLPVYPGLSKKELEHVTRSLQSTVGALRE